MVASLDQAAKISLRELSNAPIFSQLRPNCEVKSALKLMPMNFFLRNCSNVVDRLCSFASHQK